MSRALWFLFFWAFVASVSLASSASGQTDSAAARIYNIKTVLHHDGRVVGAPEVTLREGSPAIVTVSTDQGYSIRMVAEEQPVSTQFGRRVSVRSEIYLRTAGEWKAIASPGLVVPLGKSASFQIDASDSRGGPAGSAFKMMMSVSDAQASASTKTSLEGTACSEKKEALWREMVSNKLPVDNAAPYVCI